MNGLSEEQKKELKKFEKNKDKWGAHFIRR